MNESGTNLQLPILSSVKLINPQINFHFPTSPNFQFTIIHYFQDVTPTSGLQSPTPIPYGQKFIFSSINLQIIEPKSGIFIPFMLKLKNKLHFISKLFSFANK